MKHMNRTIASLGLNALLVAAPFAVLPALAENALSAADMAAVKISYSRVLSIAGKAYSNLSLFAMTLDKENGVLVYQAEGYNPADNSTVDIHIDSASGQLLALEADTDDLNEGDGESGHQTENDQNGQELEDENDPNESETGNGTGNETGTGDGDPTLLQSAAVTLSQAQELVLRANPGASVTGIELQNENGSPVFEVAFIDADGHAQTVKIDAVSSAFLSEDVQSETN